MHLPDHPISLRPIGTFGPTQNSVFEDPGDEKSWHISQRSESLGRFYEGREPSWYESAVAPLRGAAKVLDIGCGPGLALANLIEHGVDTVLGLDRWPSFARSAEARGVPMALHDLTLPMPFIDSASFDGILSHYVLNYMSPIGVRQVLRECKRILAPNGLLLLYLGAIGLGSGDESQTVPYSRATVESLLLEAGFTEMEVESSPNGRNTVARARQGDAPNSPPEAGPSAMVTGTGAQVEVEGELQLTSAFVECAGGPIRISARHDHRAATLEFGGGKEGERVAVCARLVSKGSRGTELQAWVWRGAHVVAAESLRLEFAPTMLQVDCEGQAEHVDAWSPPSIGLEPVADAYSVSADLPPADQMNEAERGEEGRRLVVESTPLDPAEVKRMVGAGRNRFLIRRPGPSTGISDLDREWQAGRALGIALDVNELSVGNGPALCLWAGARQALLLIEGKDWPQIAAGFSEHGDRMADGPVLLIDPSLQDATPGPIDAEVASLAAAHENCFLVLSPATREASADSSLAPLENRVLTGGRRAENKSVIESFRFLTERTLLMRLRQTAPRPFMELGRRPGL